MADTQTWAWVSGSIAGAIDASMSGTVVSGSTYRDDVIYKDPNNDGILADTDNLPSNISQPAVDEGVEIGGTFYQFEQFTVWTATLDLSDGTTFSATGLHVLKLDDGTLFYRLSDANIQTLISLGYSYKRVDTITLDTFSSNFENVGISNRDDAFICFTSGTNIEAGCGLVAVEELRVGQLICTIDKGYQPILWIGRRRVASDELKANPKLYPVRITAGALGNGLPERDLVVSRQHRMLVSSKIAEEVCGALQVLIPAIKLTNLQGIYVDETFVTVDYYHLLFENHEVIFAEGAPTESLFTGPLALKALGSELREEVFTLFPELKKRDYNPEPAFLIPPNNMQKRLITRHLKKNKPLNGH